MERTPYTSGENDLVEGPFLGGFMVLAEGDDSLTTSGDACAIAVGRLPPNREDWHVCESSQAGVSSRAYTPGPYSPRESLPAAWDREYLRQMQRR